MLNALKGLTLALLCAAGGGDRVSGGVNQITHCTQREARMLINGPLLLIFRHQRTSIAKNADQKK